MIERQGDLSRANPLAGLPERTGPLGAEAKREWMRIVPQFRACGLPTVVGRADGVSIRQNKSRPGAS